MSGNAWTSGEIEAAFLEFNDNGFKANVPQELHDDLNWGDYRDGEKREMAFYAGAKWALERMRKAES